MPRRARQLGKARAGGARCAARSAEMTIAKGANFARNADVRLQQNARAAAHGVSPERDSAASAARPWEQPPQRDQTNLGAQIRVAEASAPENLEGGYRTVCRHQRLDRVDRGTRSRRGPRNCRPGSQADDGRRSSLGRLRALSTGDGIFALFGAPIAHETSSAAALLAALRTQQELRRYPPVLAPKAAYRSRFELD